MMSKEEYLITHHKNGDPTGVLKILGSNHRENNYFSQLQTIVKRDDWYQQDGTYRFMNYDFRILPGKKDLKNTKELIERFINAK